MLCCEIVHSVILIEGALLAPSTVKTRDTSSWQDTFTVAVGFFSRIMCPARFHQCTGIVYEEDFTVLAWQTNYLDLNSIETYKSFTTNLQ